MGGHSPNVHQRDHDRVRPKHVPADFEVVSICREKLGCFIHLGKIIWRLLIL